MTKEILKNILIFFLCQIYAKSGNVILLTISTLTAYSITQDLRLSTIPLVAQYIGVIFGAFLSAFTMRRWGRKKGFMLGGFLGFFGAIFACLSIVDQNFYGLIFATFLIGVYNAFGMLYRFAVTDITPKEHKSVAVSYVLSAGLIAAFVGAQSVLLGNNIFTNALYAGSYLLIGVFALASIITIYFVKMPHTCPHEMAKNSRSILGIISQRDLLFAIFAGATIHSLHNLVITLIPLKMTTLGYTQIDIVNIVKYHVLAMFAPSFITGSLIKKYRIKNIFTVGFILLALSAFFLNNVNTYMVIVLGVVFLGVAWNFIFVSATTLITHKHTFNEKEKTQLVNEVFMFSVVAILSLFSGYLYSSFGWTIVIAAVITSLLILIIMMLFSKIAD